MQIPITQALASPLLPSWVPVSYPVTQNFFGELKAVDGSP